MRFSEIGESKVNSLTPFWGCKHRDPTPSPILFLFVLYWDLSIKSGRNVQASDRMTDSMEVLPMQNSIQNPPPKEKQFRTRLSARFLAKVDILGDDECWEWKASRTFDGYGNYRLNGGMRKAHRVAYAFYNGAEIPAGLCVLHRCDNPACVNPSHLWLGTRTDNNADMKAKGRGVQNGVKGTAHYRTNFSNADILKIRAMYKSGHYLQREIGDMFGICQSYVSELVNRKKWTHI